MHDWQAERPRTPGRPHFQPLTLWAVRLLALAAAANIVIRL